MAVKQEFLHPMIYTGPKDTKDVSHLFAAGKVVQFSLGPLSEVGQPLEGQKYAHVTEAQGHRLLQVDPKLFMWPASHNPGPQTVSREEFEALAEEHEALAAQVKELFGRIKALEKAAEKAGKPKPETPPATPAVVPPNPEG